MNNRSESLLRYFAGSTDVSCGWASIAAHAERSARRTATGRVTVEGVDHLAAVVGVVHHQAPDQCEVVVAEGLTSEALAARLDAWRAKQTADVAQEPE